MARRNHHGGTKKRLPPRIGADKRRQADELNCLVECACFDGYVPLSMRHPEGRAAVLLQASMKFREDEGSALLRFGVSNLLMPASMKSSMALMSFYEQCVLWRGGAGLQSCIESHQHSGFSRRGCFVRIPNYLKWHKSSGADPSPSPFKNIEGR
jgi:hypothetical protein